MNVLITSLSRKVSLAKEVKKVLGETNQLFGMDQDPDVVGKYFVDEFFVQEDYLYQTPETLLKFCLDHEIQAIIPTRNGELPFFSKLQSFFEEHGIHIMVSKLETVNTCLDKWAFFQTLKEIATLPQTALDINRIEAEYLVVKERFGAGSDKLLQKASLRQAKSWGDHLKNPLYQTMIQGREYSVDLYFTRQGRYHGGIVRERVSVERGESKVTQSVHHPSLLRASETVGETLLFAYHVVMQWIEEEHTGDLYLIECNPRFGGASNLSLNLGLHSIGWFFQEIQGVPLSPFQRVTEEKCLVRYPEDRIFDV